MAAVEDEARQTAEATPGERTRRLAQSTRRRLVRAGVAAGTMGYLVPAMRRLAAADGQVAVSPPPVILTKTITISSGCEVSGVITLINQTSKSLSIVGVTDTLVGIANQIVTFGTGTGSTCSIRLATGASVPAGGCASVPYSIAFSQESIASVTIVNRAVVTYQLEGKGDVLQVEAHGSVTWRCET